VKQTDRPLAVRFGKNVRMARLCAGYSQEELGILCALHRTAISMIEKGERLPRLDTVLKITTALEMPLPDLVQGIPKWVPAKSGSGTWT
jgi:transcriptional regulator with XRE-family HTH domain